jgi:chromosome partitioning protein
MPITITIAQAKGGVGKTTLAVSLAGELSRRGCDVALVDSDPQRSASQWAEPGNLHFPVYEIGLATETVANWANTVRDIRAECLVIDTAPSARELGASIALADLILVPCTASGLDLEATQRTLAIIEAVRDRRTRPIRVILVPNRIDRRTLEGQQLYEELQSFGETVSGPIANRSAFVRSFTTGESVCDFATGQPADLDIRGLCDLVVDTLAEPVAVLTG